MDCQVCRASAQLHFPHQKSTIFNTWIVRRSFCNKFIARQGKSTDNTLCIIEHFDVVLRRICRKNRTPFESPMASRRGIIRTRLKISILGIFWLVVLERHKAFLRPPHQNLSQNTRFLGRRILRLSKIVIIEPKTQVILSD